MNGDALELADMIQKVERNLSQQLSDYRAEMAAHNSGIDVRVNNLEDKIKTQENRQWYHSIGVTMLNFTHHVLSTHFGWKV